MSEPRKLRCYQYVTRPYDEVRALLHREPLELLQRATGTATARGGALVATLHVAAAGIEMGVDIKPSLTKIRDAEGVAGLPPATVLEIDWAASRNSALFPTMHLELSAWPLSSTETQLEVVGEYRPPLGAVGKVMDAAVMHRVAEASVHRFLEDVVEQLRADLPPAP